MSKKATLKSVRLDLETGEPNKAKKPQQSQAVKDLLKARPSVTANPPKGERGSFERLSLTLPEELLNNLRAISFKRKMSKQPNAELVSIVREAISSFLQKEQG